MRRALAKEISDLKNLNGAIGQFGGKFVLAGVVCALLAACDEPAPDEAAEELTEEITEENNEASADQVSEEGAGTEPSSAPERAFWRLESDGTVYEGHLSQFFVLDGDPMIQFFNRDAVNLGLAFDGEMEGVRTVTYAMFADAREPICERVGEEDSFKISFEPSDKDWLTGSFSGMLGCPDYRLMPVNGSFHIRAEGE